MVRCFWNNCCRSIDKILMNGCTNSSFLVVISRQTKANNPNRRTPTNKNILEKTYSRHLRIMKGKFEETQRWKSRVSTFTRLASNNSSFMKFLKI